MAERDEVIHKPRVFPRPTHMLSIVATSVVLVAAAYGTAGAATHIRGPHRHGHGGYPVVKGTVASNPVGGDFTITTRSDVTITVDTTTTTTSFYERGVPSASIADVTTGEFVKVFGTISSSTVTATRVKISATPAIYTPPAAAGVVATAPVSGDFTITTRSNSTLTIDTTMGVTTYVEHLVSAPSIANVTPGELVVAFGTLSGTTVTASEVIIFPANRHDFVVAGTVASAPADNVFTVTTRGGTTETIDATSTTVFAEWGVKNASISNVMMGDYVAVFGTTSGTTVTANEIVIAGNHASGFFGCGGRHNGSRHFGSFGFGRGSGNAPRNLGNFGFGGRGRHG
jgi:hypothetical protein